MQMIMIVICACAGIGCCCWATVEVPLQRWIRKYHIAWVCGGAGGLGGVGEGWKGRGGRGGGCWKSWRRNLLRGHPSCLLMSLTFLVWTLVSPSLSPLPPTSVLHVPPPHSLFLLLFLLVFLLNLLLLLLLLLYSSAISPLLITHGEACSGFPHQVYSYCLVRYSFSPTCMRMSYSDSSGFPVPLFRYPSLSLSLSLSVFVCMSVFLLFFTLIHSSISLSPISWFLLYTLPCFLPFSILLIQSHVYSYTPCYSYTCQILCVCLYNIVHGLVFCLLLILPEIQTFLFLPPGTTVFSSFTASVFLFVCANTYIVHCIWLSDTIRLEGIALQPKTCPDCLVVSVQFIYTQKDTNTWTWYRGRIFSFPIPVWHPITMNAYMANHYIPAWRSIFFPPQLPPRNGSYSSSEMAPNPSSIFSLSFPLQWHTGKGICISSHHLRVQGFSPHAFSMWNWLFIVRRCQVCLQMSRGCVYIRTSAKRSFNLKIMHHRPILLVKESLP